MHQAVSQDIFTQSSPLAAGNISLSKDIIDEIEKQLTRRFMTFNGGKLNMTDGVALYANSINAAQHIYRVQHTKDNKLSQNPNLHGHNFEALETFAENRQAIVDGSSNITVTTDDLFARKNGGESISEDLGKYAVRNHQHADIVTYAENSAVVSTAQLKHVKSSACLLSEAYTTSPDAPDWIVVPEDKLQKHRGDLDDIIRRSGDPEKRRRAEIARAKLRGGKTQSSDSYSPYLTAARQTLQDGAIRAGTNTGNALLCETGSFIIGGVLWEIRDSCENPEHTPLSTRLQRLFEAAWEKLCSSALLRSVKEGSLEIFHLLLGILKQTFSSLGSFLSMLGKSISAAWESICDYFSGKIKSFSELVTVISKTVAAVGISTVALLLESHLSGLGLPAVISGLLAAALAGVCIVFVNKGIEALIFSVTSMFSKAAAARMRREKIAALCDEILPKLVEDRARFQAFVDNYYAQRSMLLSQSFAEIHHSLAVKDNTKLFAGLESINQLYGTTLGWISQEDFDAKMLDTSYPFTL